MNVRGYAEGGGEGEWSYELGGGDCGDCDGWAQLRERSGGIGVGRNGGWGVVEDCWVCCSNFIEVKII